MARTPTIACSILGTPLIGSPSFVLACALALGSFALALGHASPAAAAGKKKKAAAEAAAEEPKEPASVDNLMEEATKEKEKPKPGKKKSKKELAAEEEQKKAEEADAAAAEKKAAEDAELAATDDWEKPPEDEKKAVVEAPKPVEKPFAEGRPWSVGLLLGYGFKTDRQTGGLGADPYGFGFGVRGGYSLDFALYLGVVFRYYLGGSSEGGGGRLGTGGQSTSTSAMEFGAEVGYEWWAGPVVIRPSLEIGTGLLFSDAMGATRSQGGMYFGPGITVVVPIDEWFIGGDVRGSLITGDGVAGVAIMATGGIRF